MYLTQEVVDKYKLDKLEDVVEEREDIDQDDEYDYPDFKWKLYFGHQGGVVNPETGEWIYEFHTPTPWGETYSKEFVAWWYGFPVELFSLDDEDGVHHNGFCDG